MRHIFVLIDGTNCVLASGTNIQKIHALCEDVSFSRYYQPGIGSLTRTPLLDRFLAPNLEPKALEVLHALEALNLKKEDRLYIFGYSRGAVIARVLAMCIASSKHLRSAAQRSGFTSSIHAQVEFLCLFDPVAGRPRPYRSTVPNHDAILEPKVKNYLELLAAEEIRPHFPSDTYSASKATRRRINSISPISEADTTADRQTAMTALGILKTRKAIWFPGTHADVGGHGRNKTIGLHTLATVVREFEQISMNSKLGIAFPIDAVQQIRTQTQSIELPPESTPGGWISRSLRNLTRRFSRRKPQAHSLVQHLGHPLCKHYSGAAAVLEEFPEYPT